MVTFSARLPKKIVYRLELYIQKIYDNTGGLVISKSQAVRTLLDAALDVELGKNNEKIHD